MRAGYEHKLYETIQGTSVLDKEQRMHLPGNERRQHLPRFDWASSGSGVGERSTSVCTRERPLVHWETIQDDVGLCPGEVSHVRSRKPALTGLAACRHDFDPTRTIMVGDRLNTDILFGQDGGVSTLLVLTGRILFDACQRKADPFLRLGITKLAEITGPNASDIVPEYVSESLGDLVAAER